MGTVFNIQKSCVNDGPGIRTTVFLKGCPLRCAWCHNPESHSPHPEIFFYPDRCIGCGRCVPVCPKGAHRIENGVHLYDRSLCTVCGACAAVCPGGALEIMGEEMTAEEVIDEVMKDKVFYDTSGGGMTLSGGEPLMQFDFALSLLALAKEKGIHTCVETCGFVPTERICKAAEVTDIFLYDWKLTDSDLHRQYTGVDNELIEKNLRTLDEMGAKTVLRCPIIPGVNDNEAHLTGIADLANSLQNILRIEVEPYHPLGNDKLRRLGKEGTAPIFETPDSDTAEEWIATIAKHTQIPVKRG